MRKTVGVWAVVLSVLVVCCICVNGYTAAAAIDGKFDEWKGTNPLAEDTKEDVGAEDVVDWTAFWAMRDNENLYFSYACAKPLDWSANAWRYNVFIDTDNNPETGYKGYDGNWAIGADYLLQGGIIFKFNGPSQTAWEWQEIGSQKYFIESNQVEIQVPYTVIGITVSQKVNILLHGDNVEKTDFLPGNYTKEVIVIK